MPISERLTLRYAYERPLPAFQNGQDIRFPETLVAAMLERFTQPGDTVLDPFAGLGTSFFVSERMNRIPFGVEADRQRYEWVRDRIESRGNLFFGDSATIGTLGLPEIDFSITSPPYMPHWHTWNPLFDGDPRQDGYDTYLARMAEIYRRICMVMKPDACLVVQADNLTDERFSPLVWDLGKTLGAVMHLEGEILVDWSENSENDNPFTHCLVFRNTRPLR